jgi:pimeloyl-ACP methyl ester carboxylesterase
LRPVILLHSFPYDIHSFVKVTPLLAAQGYRVVVPYMRGHGTTTFLSSSTPRDARQSVMAPRPDGRAQDREGHPGGL